MLVHEPATEKEDLRAHISAKALDKSGRVLKALGLLYFPFHDIALTELFTYYGPLAFVAAAIYQADEMNELSTTRVAPSLKTIASYLWRRGLLDERIKKYLRDGERYLRLEHRARVSRITSMKALTDAMYCRSSDFRILHCVLHQLSATPYDQHIFDAFVPFELIMEFEDDISSFQRDREANSFNFVRQLQSLCGRDVVAFVESQRAEALSHLSERSRKLTAVQARRLAGIFEVYRALVPEPDISAVLRCASIPSDGV